MHSHTKRNALTYALQTLNHDEGALAAHLGVPIAQVVDYLHGKQEIPIPILQKAIRLVLTQTKTDNATQSAVLRKIKEAKKHKA